MIAGVYTTGEAAKLARVSQQTIIRCFSSGLLKGYRVPGSRFRRIPHRNLVTFMKEHGIPTDLIEPQQKALIVAEGELRSSLEREFSTSCATRSVWGLFDTGMAVKEFTPSIVVIDCRTKEGATIARCIREACPETELIVIQYAAALLENVTFTAVVTVSFESTPTEIARGVRQRRAA